MTLSDGQISIYKRALKIEALKAALKAAQIRILLVALL